MPPILIVTRNYLPAQGGVETLVSELVAHAAKNDIKIVLVHIGQERWRRAQAGAPSGEAIYIHLPGTHRLFAMAVSILAIPLLVWYYRPRFILNVQVTTAIGSWCARHFFKIRYFVMAHGLEVLPAHDPWLRGLKTMSLRGARKIISNSRFTDGLISGFGVDQSHRTIVKPGTRFWPPTDATQTREALFGTQAASRYVCLSMSRLVPRKGIDIALDAVSVVVKTRRDILYCIGGSGPDLGRLKSIVAEKKLEEYVRFLGRVPDESMGAAYARADLFLLPSRITRNPPSVEGFGIVFLEAAACGTPSLAGNNGGMPDAVIDGVTGFLVDATDPSSIAEKILQLMEDRDLLHRLGKGALAHARESTWEKACVRYYEAFTDADEQG